jgi:hypothetical protein
LDKLTQAERHLLEGRETVVRLRAFVARLKETDHDALSADAERLVDQFERLVTMLEDRRRAIPDDSWSLQGQLIN